MYEKYLLQLEEQILILNSLIRIKTVVSYLSLHRDLLRFIALHRHL